MIGAGAVLVATIVALVLAVVLGFAGHGGVALIWGIAFVMLLLLVVFLDTQSTNQQARVLSGSPEPPDF